LNNKEKYYGQIYCIENKLNNKKYIGQTINKDIINGRYRGNIEKNTCNNHLKYSIKKYGIDNFKVYTIYFCNDKNELNKYEKYYINKYNTLDCNYGYNQQEGGRGGRNLPQIQNHINKANKEYWESHPETKRYMSVIMSGDNNPMHIKGGHSKASKEKMSETRKRMIKNGEINIEKARLLSHSKEAELKRTKTKSKYKYILSDFNMNKLGEWYSLRQMYKYINDNNIPIKYKSYGSFKLIQSRNKLFDGKCHDGYYYEIIDKIAN
jgi:group I intron endonuclease